MKKLVCIALLLSRCATSEDPIESILVGEWRISWETEEEYRSGVIKLNNDHSASITTLANPNSNLLPSATEAHYQWNFDNYTLQLTRMDNPITLSYSLLARTENNILFDYTNDIRVTLSK